MQMYYIQASGIVALTVFLLVPSMMVANASGQPYRMVIPNATNATNAAALADTQQMPPLMLNPDLPVNINTTIFDVHDQSYFTFNQFLQNYPYSEVPIPNATLMFTPDEAQIMRVEVDPHVLEVVQTPKELFAREPSTFIVNNFLKNNTWLWHTDYAIDIINSNTRESVLSIPQLHGHGSVSQFTHIFPTSGQYEIDVTWSQQTDSPNYYPPRDVNKASFTVDVGEPLPAVSTKETIVRPIKDITMYVESWDFTPDKINVTEGDLVRLHFITADDEVSLYNGHGFGIEGYNINAYLIKDTNQTIEFVADKPGIFTFRCTSFCAFPSADPLQHFEMEGTFTVSDRPADQETGTLIDEATNRWGNQ